jgi:mannose-6-phosphate isomerase-like protein (cupin superfamily)
MANTKQMTIDDIKLINCPGHDEDGVLVPIEAEKQIPFKIKRIFYVYGVEDCLLPRGCHAHHKTKQVLICLNGKIEVTCKDGTEEKKFLLESPQQAIYIPEMIWDEQKYKTPDSILLSICSTQYDPKDYINDYEEFKSIL